jgi:TatA/E family protein of Tat protein translocase
MPLPNGAEWIVILIIALLILGPGKLPDVASAVGKSIREFRKASSDVQEAVKVDTSPLPASSTASTAQAAPPPAPETPAAPVATSQTAPPPAPQPASSDVTTESR